MAGNLVSYVEKICRRQSFDTLPEINTPVYFIEGNGDKQKSHYLVEDYYKFVKAPKKGMFWMKKSGHTIFNTEPDKLQK